MDHATSWLDTVRCDVVVRARKDDILKIPTDMEMLGYPFFIFVSRIFIG
jgi:hypothetical protein